MNPVVPSTLRAGLAALGGKPSPGARLRGRAVWRSGAATLLAGLLCACSGWQLKSGKALATTPATVLAPLADETPAAVVPETKPSAPFLLDEKPFCFQGSNNYYLTWKSERMIDDVFANAKRLGLKVLRHWAFEDRGSIDGSVASIDGDGTKEGVYFQYWDPAAGRPAYNDGPNGLQRLDAMMVKARDADVRIVLVLVNNWHDFGGMDQYLTWYGLKEHPEFYTDPHVKQAYKNWVTHVVNRVNALTGIAYKDDPYVFAWELANEPRIRNYTRFDSPRSFDGATITNWAREMAAHVRSLDPNHLIAVGDEGFYTGGDKSYYAGEEGVDHDALLRIPDIDYGTFHLYPDHWKTDLRWADQWIEDHIVSARNVGKPTVLEEYGIRVKRDVGDETLATRERNRPAPIIFGFERRERAYHRWNQHMMLRGGAGSMFWMIAGVDDYHGRYRDYDGFTVYSPDEDPTAKMLVDYGQRMPSESQACTTPVDLTPRRQAPTGFVTAPVPSTPRAASVKTSSPQWDATAMNELQRSE
jgi:mannan endo-1,4-beta-mannosidase